jgi:hypothetical protein
MNKKITEYKDIEVKESGINQDVFKWQASGWLMWETEDEFKEWLKIRVITYGAEEEGAKSFCYEVLQERSQSLVKLWEVKDLLKNEDLECEKFYEVSPMEGDWGMFYKRILRKVLGFDRRGVGLMEEIKRVVNIEGLKFDSKSFILIDADGRGRRCSDGEVIDILKKCIYKKEVKDGSNETDMGK